MNLVETGVRFDKGAHTYTTADGLPLQGVTPIVAWMFPRTYDGIPEEVLQRAAQYGSVVHAAIETYCVTGFGTDEKVMAFSDMMTRECLSVERNEYLVTDGKAVASSIDLVMTRNGEIVLGDIKTTSQLHIENVRLQLSIYAYLFEMQTGKIVSRLAAIWIPKSQYGQPCYVELERIPSDMCEGIINAYLSGGSPDPWRKAIGVNTMPVETSNTALMSIKEMEREIVAIETEAKRLKEQSDKLRDGLLKIMAESGAKEFDGEFIKVTRKAATTRDDFDKKRFQTDHPDIYREYIKTTKVKESITIKIK